MFGNDLRMDNNPSHIFVGLGLSGLRAGNGSVLFHHGGTK